MTDTKKSGKAVKNVEKTQSKKQTKTETKKVEEHEEHVEQKEQKQVSSDKCVEQLQTSVENLNKLKEMCKAVYADLKKAQNLHTSELKKAKSARKSERKKNHNPTGFARLRPVTGKLADFIGVESGAELSGPAVTKRVWQELKNRNLTWKGDEKEGVKGDQRVLRVDDDVAKLFNVPKSVNNSTNHKDPNGLNFGNLQRYIKNAMEPEPEPEAKHESKSSNKKEKTLSK